MLFLHKIKYNNYNLPKPGLEQNSKALSRRVDNKIIFPDHLNKNATKIK